MQGVSFRHVAARFGLSSTALCRHKHKCLAGRLEKAFEDRAAEENAQILELLERVMEAIGKALDAEKRPGDPDWRIRLKAVDITLKLFDVL